jgi:hypothetical protein
MKKRGTSGNPNIAEKSAFSGFGLNPPTKNPQGPQKIAEPPGFFCYTLSHNFIRAESKTPSSFDFVTDSSRHPLVGYLIPSELTAEIVPALRVEIDGKWNNNPSYLIAGSMMTSFGHLRSSAVADWSEHFRLNKPWIIKLWSRIHHKLKRLITEDYVKKLGLMGYEYYPILPFDKGLTETEKRYIAVVSLWNYWKKHPSKEESKCDDLQVIGITKRSSGAKKGGKAIGDKISKGAFTTIASRAGVK